MTRNKDNMYLPRYRTNKIIRSKIDKLLEENAKIWCNLGTETPLDVGTREKGERKWKKIAKQIKELDEEYYNRLCPYGIDS
tara:strand:+ start:382 stop:624 length:243 start_codon:yes stop_codon:yes gene_type:complete